MSTIEKELPFASFSHNLKLFRTERRITLQDLSDATGLSISYLSQLEREEKSCPSAEVVYSLCRALKVGFAALLGVVEPPEMAGSVVEEETASDSRDQLVQKLKLHRRSVEQYAERIDRLEALVEKLIDKIPDANTVEHYALADGWRYVLPGMEMDINLEDEQDD